MCKGGEFCVDSGNNICAERMRLCINESLRCNGISNCAENDNSDEIYCKLNKIFFKNYYFFLGYSQGTFTLISLTSFLLFLISTLIVLTIRSFLRCRSHRKRLKNTRECFEENVMSEQQKKLKLNKQLRSKQSIQQSSEPVIKMKVNGMPIVDQETIEVVLNNVKDKEFSNTLKSETAVKSSKLALLPNTNKKNQLMTNNVISSTSIQNVQLMQGNFFFFNFILFKYVFGTKTL